MKLYVVAAQVLLLTAATMQSTFAETENPALRENQVQLPNDTELKASYCMVVLKLQRSTLAQLGSPESGVKSDPAITAITKIDDRINRIRMFILPKIPYLEPFALLAANSRGKADFEQQQESSKAAQCIDKCKHQDSSCLQVCMEEDELNRRIFQCHNLSFLPY